MKRSSTIIMTYLKVSPTMILGKDQVRIKYPKQIMKIMMNIMKTMKASMTIMDWRKMMQLTMKNIKSARKIMKHKMRKIMKQ